VLSPTHLHEFKSADRIYTQPPVMSLLLSDQKLGSRSQPGSSSHKFSIKGRQTGSMHRGHSWIFRAESYETMLAWYDDIQSLTEKTGEERNAFVRKHARSFSGASKTGSDSGLEEDEADEVPYSASASFSKQMLKEPPQQRPQPGRFPSELSNNQLNGHLQPPLSPSSGSSLADQDLTTAAGGLQGDGHMYPGAAGHVQPLPTHHDEQSYPFHHQAQAPESAQQVQASFQTYSPPGSQPNLPRGDSNQQTWVAPAAGGAVVGAGALAAEEYWRNQKREAEYLQHQQSLQQETPQPALATQSSTQEHPSTLPDTHEPALTDAHTTTVPTTTAPTPISSDIPVVTALPIPSTTTKPSEPIDTATHEPIAASSQAPSTNAGTATPKPLSRKNTDYSISNLHIPGEYPKTTV
jgi:hypothetical protein